MTADRGHRSNLASVNLLGRKKDNPDSGDESNAVDVTETSGAEGDAGVGSTAPKGRPTPKRSASARKRGPVAPAPMTSAEARQRRKELRNSQSKEERKADRQARRADMDSRRAKMMAGDEAFLLPRDKGPVKRYVRDLVDSRRNVLGLFMPSALALVFFMMALPPVQTQGLLSIAMLALMIVMAIDGVLLSRRINKRVNAKFPDNIESGWKLGFYAASRASQLRRMRVPKPQVSRGDKVD
ncbi:DUF3043 domain-containing protein [Mycobacterium sp. CBMA293]|nr:DUF3043 domain-containing protein [Mycolicibacterium sp. CBMA 360]MUL60195.1 DUF3043 domain-containing protein [Mycolicibacterium sp. CBMA 335]MUL72982.1 DUF3043 domain-containing protein [Mycolicibacterium sp. CBMA 311]MUL96043.1 DUF3043 domain-containing protein [Mycolicibacterium sp. CBMA 230]MUM14133.1 DUF3043 domain-containing protein [Mycolicibacterium sp. CBMA 293]MUL45525.1 DUF3043 domain-containing protein [Mycolicibacterium sp. CBMA 360]